MSEDKNELARLSAKLPPSCYQNYMALWCGDIKVNIDYLEYVGGPLDNIKAVKQMLKELGIDDSSP